MDVFLDDKTSLFLTRATATNKGIALAPTDARQGYAPAIRPFGLKRLGIPELLAYLHVPEERPLGIIVPNRKVRVRAKGVTCSVTSSLRGEVPFLQLRSAQPNEPSPVVPSSTDVFVQSPLNIVLGMARRLRRLEITQKMSHQQALLMLVKLCLELCGTYSHDPFDPHKGLVIYDTKPVLNVDDLRACLEEPGSEQGLSLAREAAALSYDLSGSPQESFLGPALFFSSRLGGLKLCEFSANVPLDLTSLERASIGHRVITPDFQLTGYNAVIEYLGEVHESGENPRIDHRRSLDYQTLGKREFAFWYEDVGTRNNFMMSAARIVSAIEQKDGPSVRKRFQALANNHEFIGRQQVLFSVFRPWLRGRSL